MDKHKRSYAFDLLLITLLIGGYFLLFIGNMPLHNPDEARYSLISYQLFQTNEYLVPKINAVAFLDKPPLFYYSQMLTLKLFGNSETALRLPSLLSSLFCCLILYITSRKLFSRTTAWYSALLLANSPLYFLMSHYANLDMMVASLINITLCFFILSTKAKNPRLLLWGAYLSMALAMLTKGLIAVAFPCCIVVIYCLIYRLKPKFYLLDGLIIFSIIVLPWFIQMHQEIEGFSYYYFVIQHFYRYLSQSFNNQQPFWFYFTIVFGCSLPWLLFNKLNSWSIKNKDTGFFLISFLFILLFFSIPSSKPLGYILPVFPPLAVLLGHSLNQQFNEQPFQGLSIVSIIIGLLFCYPWQPLQAYFHEINPIALLITISGCLGLLIQLCFASPLQLPQVKLIKRQHCFVGLLSISMMYLNLTGLQIIQSLEHDSMKPVTQYLDGIDKKRSPIAMLHQFYYDLPYYSKDRVIYAVDNWQKGIFKGDLLTEQFALGMQYHQPKTFIYDEDFQRKWHNKKNKLFVVTNESNYKALLKDHGHLLLAYRGIYLLSN